MSELILSPTSGFPRKLRINLDQERINVGMYGRQFYGNRYAFATSKHKDARLRLALSEQCLWVGDACFELTSTECERVRTTFEQLGLRVQQEIPSSVLSSRCTEHEAAAAADPLSNECGAPSLPVCTGRDALESAALVSRESY